MPVSWRTLPNNAEVDALVSKLDEGSRIVVALSAGPRLAGRQGIVVGQGGTKRQFRAVLDGSKNPSTLHARFLSIREV